MTRKQGGTSWNFNTPIEIDITLHAGWTLVGYPITFKYHDDVDGKEGTADSQEVVEYGKYVTRPSDPALAGHGFVGWFDQESEGTEWQFSDDVNPKAVGIRSNPACPVDAAYLHGHLQCRWRNLPRWFKYV